MRIAVGNIVGSVDATTMFDNGFLFSRAVASAIRAKSCRHRQFVFNHVVTRASDLPLEAEDGDLVAMVVASCLFVGRIENEMKSSSFALG